MKRRLDRTFESRTSPCRRLFLRLPRAAPNLAASYPHVARSAVLGRFRVRPSPPSRAHPLALTRGSSGSFHRDGLLHGGAADARARAPRRARRRRRRPATPPVATRAGRARAPAAARAAARSAARRGRRLERLRLLHLRRGPHLRGPPRRHASPPSDDPTRISVDDVLRDSSSSETFASSRAGGGAVRDFRTDRRRAHAQHREPQEQGVHLLGGLLRVRTAPRGVRGSDPRPAAQYPSVVPRFPASPRYLQRLLHLLGRVRRVPACSAACSRLWPSQARPRRHELHGLHQVGGSAPTAGDGGPHRRVPAAPSVSPPSPSRSTTSRSRRRSCACTTRSGYLTCAECCTSDRPRRIVDPAARGCGCFSGAGR